MARVGFVLVGPGLGALPGIGCLEQPSSGGNEFRPFGLNTQKFDWPRSYHFALGVLGVGVLRERCRKQGMRSKRSTTEEEENEVVADGTLMGTRPKARYIWQVPQAAAPEILLAGRSNAGKSTLLNAILKAAGAKQAAPMSRKGGRTRSLNWYPIGFSRPLGWHSDGKRIVQEAERNYGIEEQLRALGQGCCLVDCFGLGTVDYSDLRAKRLQTWGPLLQNFLSERRAIKTLCHLISSEQEGFLSEGDLQLVDILRRCEAERAKAAMAPARYVVVLTKTDLAPGKIEVFQEKLQRGLTSLKMPPAAVIPCTSMVDDGTTAFGAVVDEAVQRGWEEVSDWISDASRLQRLPAGRSRSQIKKVKAAYVSSARQSGKGPARGGKGASTIMPPRV
mmetsp:Transcript_29585/g.55365  ORF Transcript_29585/g.55365 Transcript_29585/m.55365 type:complete len:391 (+) Transcript_29585:19-1191(+)